MPVVASVAVVLVVAAMVLAWRRHRRARAFARLTPEQRALIVGHSLSRARAKQRRWR